jgi:arylsulfatase A-like enzyme/cytochrome c-type biogenesis protein CcmH/NrfG
MKSSSARTTAAAALVAIATLALFAGACRQRSKAAPSAAGWNLLLVTLDTLRADRVGCYGRPNADTPALDALAGRGLRFAEAQSAVPLTLPSHATILSGLLPPRHGLRDNGLGVLPADVPTLATRLSAAGYRTGAFVGAFVLDHRFGLDRGFARYDDEIQRSPDELEGERPGAEVVDRALSWLRDAPAGGAGERQPFFAWVHLYDAHAPYEPPEPFRSRHRDDRYAGEVAAVDAQVGRLVAALERQGVAARTVVAVVADHGEALGEHGELTHGLLLYQGTLRVPLVVVVPGVLAPRVVREPVGLADLAPTLAALLGQPLAAPLDGRDLSATFGAGGEPQAADLYSETRYPATFGWSPIFALRRRELKYVEAPRAELYDLARDPAEAHDLRAERRREAVALREALASMGREVRRAAPAPADEESRSRLRALGYAVPGGAGRAGQRDPKDAVRLFRAFEEAHWAQDEGRLAAAEAILRPLVAEDPGNAVFRSTLGRVLRDEGKVAQALPFYREAVALAPADPQAWYELATALQGGGRQEEARAALEEALRRDPGRPQAHNALAIALAAEGRLGDARAHLQTALAVDPRDAQVWNNLGNVLRDLGEGDAAAAAYEKAIALDPRYPDPLNGRGALEVARQRPAAAIPWFDRALALAPAQHEARLNRGIALELMGDRRAAAAAYRDFLSHVGGDPEYARQRGVAQGLLARLSGTRS